jgi:hypothetical protein
MKRIILVSILCACGDTTSPSGNDGGGRDGAIPGMDANTPYDAGPLVDEYLFSDAPTDAFQVQIDHLGFALISTVLVSRDDGYNCQGVNNQTQALALYQGLVEVHRMWGDELEADGYPTCAIGGVGTPTEENILDFLATVPCGTQSVNRVLPSGETIEGPRVLDLITPDFAQIDVDEPGGFPNGQLPSDQITDQVLAMGLVDLSSTTIDQIRMNPPANDVPFPEGFPYLAPAHSDVPPRLYP